VNYSLFDIVEGKSHLMMVVLKILGERGKDDWKRATRFEFLPSGGECRFFFLFLCAIGGGTVTFEDQN